MKPISTRNARHFRPIQARVVVAAEDSVLVRAGRFEHVGHDDLCGFVRLVRAFAAGTAHVQTDAVGGFVGGAVCSGCAGTIARRCRFIICARSTLEMSTSFVLARHDDRRAFRDQRVAQLQRYVQIDYVFRDARFDARRAAGNLRFRFLAAGENGSVSLFACA
jgi:hypothetical protein